MDCFMDFVRGTAGEQRVAFWIAAEKLNLANDKHSKSNYNCRKYMF